jgi:hypothetical protein
VNFLDRFSKKILENQISLIFLQLEPSCGGERERERETNGWTDRHEEGNRPFQNFSTVVYQTGS